MLAETRRTSGMVICLPFHHPPQDCKHGLTGSLAFPFFEKFPMTRRADVNEGEGGAVRIEAEAIYSLQLERPRLKEAKRKLHM